MHSDESTIIGQVSSQGQGCCHKDFKLLHVCTGILVGG